jgi:CheY-like chemotaxis protein
MQMLLAPESEVVAVVRAADALELLARSERFDVILCDLMMPQSSGMQLYEQVARTAPEYLARMIFMTGGAFTPQAREFLASLGRPYLQKPFSAQQLRDALAKFRAGERYDVVLCDLMMPEMTGMDLHAELSHSHPEDARRIIFVTGGAFTSRAREFLENVPNLPAHRLRWRVGARVCWWSTTSRSLPKWYGAPWGASTTWRRSTAPRTRSFASAPESVST